MITSGEIKSRLWDGATEPSSVTGMGSMFNGCTNLESVNLSSFDTHSVISMSSMFQGC